MTGDKNNMLIRRRPSAATLVAIVTTLAIGSQASFAAGSSQSGRGAPDAVSSVEVTATDRSSVTIAWPPSRDTDVVGYGVYVNGARAGTQTPDQVRRWRDRDALSYTIGQLACGTGYTVGVDAFDRGDRHSPLTTTTVSTSACPDATPPAAPTGVRQVAATENSVMLAWTASSDSVGVVEYGLYASGVRVSTVTDASATLTNLACGKSYLIAIDAADAAGNRSAQVSSFFRTSACPSTNKPPSTPTLVQVAKATQTTVALAWTASTDDVGVTGYGLYLSGSRTSETPGTTGELTGLKCGTTYTLGVDAKDAGGLRSAVASLSTATSPCSPPPPSSTGAVTQTIANGATVASLVNWRAVYDRNGDGTEDDPGSIQFLVDGNQVLSEINPPFGDTFANGTITTSNGQHTFQVRALNDSGTLLATNTVTATIGSGTPPPPPPPPSSTGAVTQTIANGATVASLVNWRAVYDRNGDGTEDDPGSIQFLVDGNQVLSEINPPFGDTFANGTITTSNGQHTFQVRALNDSGTLLATNTVTATIGSGTPPPPPPPPSSTGAVTQTIANGATVASLVNWRAVYDRNGDGTEDDPGSIQFLVDGNQVLSEINPPFGDTFANGTITTSNGQHTFQVRALNDSGTLLATNTVTATIGSGTPPPPPPTGDRIAPSQPGNLRVATASPTGVAIAWNAATDNIGVTGYDLYRSSSRMGTTPQTTASFNSLTCGTGYPVGVDAFDAAGNTSPPTNMTVTTSPCADTQPPTAPTNVTVSTRTTTSIALTWAPSTDNIGVAGYGVYNGADLVDTTAGNSGIASGLTCGTNYTLAVDAFDATGNSSPKTAVMVSTLACADTTAPTVTMTSPANGSTVTGTINASANAADNVGVTRVEFLRDGVSLASDTSSPYSIAFNTTTIANGSHTFGARAYDSAGNVGNATNVTVTVSNTTPPPPPLTGFPDASNTGVPAGMTLTAYTGPSNITAPNTVIDGKTIGCIDISAPGVTIRNSRISCPGGYAIYVGDSGPGTLLIEDSEVDCKDQGGTAIGEAEVTARRLDISKCENGFDVNQNITIEDSYIHDLYQSASAHPDGLQFAAGHWNGSSYVCCVLNLTIRHNTIYGTSEVDGAQGNAAIISGRGGDTNILIENNLFAGGGYTLYCEQGARGTNYRVLNNHFSTRFSSKVGFYGPSTDCSDETQSGNVYHETGQALSLG